MKITIPTLLIILTSLFANAQSTIIRGVSITIAHHDEELNDFVWGETQFMDFKVEMYKDTVTIYYPYQTTQIITGEYQKIDDESEGWKSVDNRGNTCFLYLINLEEATWIKLEYSDRAYIIEIESSE